MPVLSETEIRARLPAGAKCAFRHRSHLCPNLRRSNCHISYMTEAWRIPAAEHMIPRETGLLLCEKPRGARLVVFKLQDNVPLRDRRIDVNVRVY